MDITRGAGFQLAFNVKVNSVTQNITNWKIKSSVRSRFGWSYDLKVIIVDALNGLYELDGDSSTWPIGSLTWDILYVTDSGQLVITKSVPVTVLQGATEL